MTGLDPDGRFPIRAILPGEQDRFLIGDAMAAGRAAQLFEVHTDYRRRSERFLRMGGSGYRSGLEACQSGSRAFEYERFRLSPQPAYYFE